VRLSAAVVARRKLLVAVLLAAVVGCAPPPTAAQATASQAPCAESAVRVDRTFHALRDARFSAALAVRQANQTHVLVADLVDGRMCSLGTWASASIDSVYVDEDRSLLVVDKDATYVIRGGATLKGPRQSVYDAFFVRGGTESRIIAWIDTRGPSQLSSTSGQSILDLTVPDQPKRLATIGGPLLGQLDDGTILVAASSGVGTNATLALQSLALDGTVKTLATVLHVRRALEFHKTPRQEVTVAVFGVERGLDDVFTVDLASGAQAKTGTVSYVNEEPRAYRSPDQTLVARNTFEFPPGVRVVAATGNEVLTLSVPAGTPGQVQFRGWVRR
jgi:hypothetical protein